MRAEPFAVRLSRELDELAVAHPRLHAVVVATSRRPEAVTVALGVLTAVGFAATVPGGDAQLFRAAGAGMVGPRFFNVFTAPNLQIGPLCLAFIGVLTRLLNLLGSAALTRMAIAGVQAALLLVLALGLVRRSARRTGAPDLASRWAVGLVLAVGGFVAEATGSGHPEELMVGLLLAHAALWAADDRPGLAGLVLGLAGGIKQWAVLGGGALLLGRRRRDVLIAIGAAFVVLAALYVPFFVFGVVHTYDFQWGFNNGSVLGRLEAQWGLTDWAMRVIQGALAGLAGAWVALRRRHSPLVPVIVAIAVRLLLDPLRLTYYSGPLVALVATWAWTAGAPRVVRWRLPLTVLSPLLVVLPYLASRDATWSGGTVLLVLTLVAVLATRETAPARGEAVVA